MTKKLFVLFLSCAITFTLFSSPPHIDAITLSENTSLLNTNDIPVVIEEENIAEMGHIQRIDTTDLDSISFLNNDDTISVYKFSENVRYIDETGTIQDKSNVLHRQTDGSYDNEHNDVKLSFSSTISDGMTLAYDDIILEMIPYVEINL